MILLVSFQLWIILIIAQQLSALESCHGAIVRNGTNQTIIDANNEMWSISSNTEIYKSGQLAGLSINVILLVYWNRTVYQENCYMSWWGWINSSWVAVTDSVLIYHLKSTSGCIDTPSTSNQDETSTSEQTATTILNIIIESSLVFYPKQCNDITYIGSTCHISNSICDMTSPCQNNGTCQNDTLNNYICSCPPDFIGIHCELDHRPCEPYNCFYHGVCNQTSNTTFNCLCNDGSQGKYCQSMINFCHNNPCTNNGVCRPLLLNYTCECLGDNFYSGRHCETLSKKIIILKIISKSSASVAIFIMFIVVLFVVMTDVLKYCFHIDLVHKERERLRRKKHKPQWKRPVIQRFVYVTESPSDNPTVINNATVA